MGGEWRLASLGESGITLIDCDHRTPPAASTGYPYVAIPQLKSGRIDLADVRRISVEHFVEWTRKANPQPFDVVLSRRCNPGETAFVTPDLKFALGQNLVLLRSNGTKILPEFLRWLVRGPHWWEQVQKFLNVGAVFDSLRCADVPKFELPVPPFAEQRAIARILGALDDKIELNRKMNATLEAMARALFKSWFVDFDPVRAKAEGRAPSGMDADTAKLFPNALVESQLGPIPKGWRAGSIGDVIEIHDSRRVPLSSREREQRRGTFPYYGATSVMDHVDAFLFEGRFVLVGEDGSVVTPEGLPFTQYVWGRFWVNNHAHVLTGIRGFSQEQLYLLFQQTNVAAYVTGAVQAKLSQGNMRKIPLVVAPDAVNAKFGSVVDPLFARFRALTEESRTLARLRDVLLPRLLSGELPVSEAERHQGAVA